MGITKLCFGLEAQYCKIYGNFKQKIRKENRMKNNLKISKILFENYLKSDKAT